MTAEEIFFKVTSSASLYTVLVVVAFLLFWIAFYKKPYSRAK
jgi:hypothetical protein